MIVILLGAPGAGKGTLARNLASQYGWEQISTGDMIRAEVARGTPLGQAARSYLDSGNLVPDDVILAIVEERLKAGKAPGFLLDGIPRTVAQAEGLDGILKRLGRAIRAVLSLEVPEEVIVGRLGNRRVCPVDGRVYNLVSLPPAVAGRCDDHTEVELVLRSDDQPETIRHRFKVYRVETSPLIELYRSRSLLRPLDGDGTVDEVAARAVAALG